MSALLSSEINLSEKIVSNRECKEMGIKVLPQILMSGSDLRRLNNQ